MLDLHLVTSQLILKQHVVGLGLAGSEIGTVGGGGLMCSFLAVPQTVTSLLGSLFPLVFIHFDPSRSSWVASDLQQILVWIIVSLPGFRHLMLMSSAQNTDLGTMMGQLLQCQWWLWRFDVYHLLPMCYIYIDISIHILTSECMYTGRSRFCGAFSLYNFWGSLWEKEYKIGYRGEYLFRGFPRALEKACVIEGTWSLSPISFTVNPPLYIHSCQFCRVCHIF